MEKLRFHLLGLAHLETRRENSACAYTQKIIKLADMLKKYGHMVYFYGVEGSVVNCDEAVEVTTQKLLREVYGDYDRTKSFFRHDSSDRAHMEFNRSAIDEINKRKQPEDILLCTMGNYQKSVSQGTGLITCAPGKGYSGVFSEVNVFESY